MDGSLDGSYERREGREDGGMEEYERTVGGEGRIVEHNRTINQSMQ